MNYSFKDPVIQIDFGTNADLSGINILPLPNYRSVESTCPEDGNYSFVSNTSDCFNGDWLTFEHDHTGDAGGRMMLVNASPEGGMFFNTFISGLKGNTTYQVSASMVNVCRISGGCPPLPPDIAMRFLTPQGQIVASFQSGLLSQNKDPHWKVYTGLFTTPINTQTLVFAMEDITKGGCGNDFALDDITLRECVKPTLPIKPVVKRESKRVVEPKTSVIKQSGKIKVEAKKTVAILSPLKEGEFNTVRRKGIDTLRIVTPDIKQKTSSPAPPQDIATRANPLVRTIDVTEGEIKIDIYDNGEIDGDTVSVYDNNHLIVSRAGLSTRPVTFNIKIDQANSIHELIMVANNLGSIPPNTSMMVITTNDNRYEIFISSSEQKNAKVLIHLKEKN